MNLNGYRKAAEKGDAETQYQLAECYYNGQGVEEDYTEAIKWYSKAAKQGFKIAKEVLDIIGEEY